MTHFHQLFTTYHHFKKIVLGKNRTLMNNIYNKKSPRSLDDVSVQSQWHRFDIQTVLGYFGPLNTFTNTVFIHKKNQVHLGKLQLAQILKIFSKVHHFLFCLMQNKINSLFQKVFYKYFKQVEKIETSKSLFFYIVSWENRN